MAATRSKVRHVILGTAGHIDHGKTTLVQRLTGTFTDRLPEERARGMTIDLGYASFTLPDGTEVGLVDVPGHEGFVHTMVAGATAMDLALLVVAADDGPMPQTHEHLEILELLGLERLVVAVTKIDLVDPDTTALAVEDVRETLGKTIFAEAPIVPVSSETGVGIADLKGALARVLLDLPEPREEEPFVFRMPVLRAFQAPGRGTVVTGIPLAGTVAVGAQVEILPAGLACRVREIQVHGEEASRASRGHRAALALSDVGVESLRRGMVVAERGLLQPATRLAARIALVRGARKPLSHRARVRLHVGAARVTAQVHLPRRQPIAPGSHDIVELQADRPVLALPGDRAILREENASGTLGGGEVVQVLDRPLRRGREALLEGLSVRPLHDAPALLEGELAAAGERGLTSEALVAGTGLTPGAVAGFLPELEGSGRIQRIGRHRWMLAAAFSALGHRAEVVIGRLHAKDPAVASLPLAALRAAMARVDPAVLDALIDDLAARGRVVRTPDGGLRHAAQTTDLPPEDRRLCELLERELDQGGGQPPSAAGMAATAGVSAASVERGLRLLASRGRAYRAGDHYFSAAWVQEARGRLAAFARSRGGFTPAEARTILGTTRKWVIPLLEAFDKDGTTRRVGEKRVLRGDST